MLLMFSLGLEFSLRKLIRVAPTAGVVAVIQCSLMIWLGYLVSAVVRLDGVRGLFAGAALAISSTTIIVKAFAEQKDQGDVCRDRVRHPDRRGSDRDPAAGGPDGGRLRRRAVGQRAGAQRRQAGRLPGRPAGRRHVGRAAPDARRGAPPQQRDHGGRGGGAVVRVRAAGALDWATRSRWGRSWPARWSPSRARRRSSSTASSRCATCSPRCSSCRSGMLIDPLLVWQSTARGAGADRGGGGRQAGRRLTIGTFLAGNGVRTSVQAALSLAQIGEFSFIIAGVGAVAGGDRATSSTRWRSRSRR